MKAPIATLSLTGLLLVSASYAQDGPRQGSVQQPAQPSSLFTRPRRPAVGPAPKTDANVYQAEAVLPAPVPPDQIRPATIVLPNDAIEPWLLTKEAGPFMVIAKTFRGPEAERYALALAMELRREHGLPAYIMRTKDFPMRTMIRNVPPTAPSYVNKSHLTDPERVRSYDEAAVLVGNEKTLADSEALLHRVKKIKPKCLNEMPALFDWRRGHGLSTAIRTTNPYIPTQNLFPGRGKRDHLLVQMNGGPRTINNCPGRYSLQVAEFTGRAVFNPSAKDTQLFGDSWLNKSPLATAADDAEQLADMLSKSPQIQRIGFQPYVYHDRTSSKVLIGSFNTPDDPAAGQLRESLLRIAGEFSAVNKATMMAPATMLTDLEDPNKPMKMR